MNVGDIRKAIEGIPDDSSVNFYSSKDSVNFTRFQIYSVKVSRQLVNRVAQKGKTETEEVFEVMLMNN